MRVPMMRAMQFNDGEENADTQQDVLHALDKLSQRREQVTVENAGPGGHQHRGNLLSFPLLQSTTVRGVPKVISRSKLPDASGSTPTVNAGCISSWWDCAADPCRLCRSEPFFSFSGVIEMEARGATTACVRLASPAAIFRPREIGSVESDFAQVRGDFPDQILIKRSRW